MRVVFVPRSVEIKPLFSDLGTENKMERAELNWKAESVWQGSQFRKHVGLEGGGVSLGSTWVLARWKAGQSV